MYRPGCIFVYQLHIFVEKVLSYTEKYFVFSLILDIDELSPNTRISVVRESDLGVQRWSGAAHIHTTDVSQGTTWFILAARLRLNQ